MSDDRRAEEIKALCRDHAEDMIAVLAEVAGNPDQKGAARVVAARTLLERGFGAPERKVEKTVDVNIHDHRQAHLKALQDFAKGRAPVVPIEDKSVVDAEFDEVDDGSAPPAKKTPKPA